MGKILVTMSGGTTAVNNSVLAGIIEEAKLHSGISGVVTAFPGVVGVLSNQFIDLTNLPHDKLEILKHSPGSASIGTTRVSPLSDSELSLFASQCSCMGIEFFINIGGNGTIKQSSLIARKATGLKVAAAPKTVDNDLGDSQYSSVLFTPGFPSCVNYWCQKLTLLNNENLGASSHDKVLVAQTFGRETGFIAGSVRFADPDRSLPLLILLPEDSQPLEVIHQYVVKTIERHGRAIVVMGEGYQVGDINAVRDSTGQIMYGSSGTPAAQVLVSYLVSKGIQARSFVPTIDQRQDPHSRTEIDVRHASLLGKDTVRALACGKKDFFISTSSRWLDGQFATTCTELTTAKDFTRSMPRTWINSGSFDVSDEYLRYLGKFIGPESLTFGRSYYGIEMCSLSSTQLSNVSVSQGGTEKPLCIL